MAFGITRRRRRTALLDSRPARDAVLSPAPDARMDGGVLVETLLVARLFGAKALRLEGTVWIAPAQVDPAQAEPAQSQPDPGPAPPPEIRPAPPVPPVPPAIGSPKVGSRLVDARRMLDESRPDRP